MIFHETCLSITQTRIFDLKIEKNCYCHRFHDHYWPIKAVKHEKFINLWKLWQPKLKPCINFNQKLKIYWKLFHSFHDILYKLQKKSSQTFLTITYTTTILSNVYPQMTYLCLPSRTFLTSTLLCIHIILRPSKGKGKLILERKKLFFLFIHSNWFL